MSEIIYKLEEKDYRNNRFVALIDDNEAGEITFIKAGKYNIIIEHTGIFEGYEGMGIAKELVKKAVDYAILNDYKVIPLCPYARKEFDRNPEYQKIEKKEE